MGTRSHDKSSKSASSSRLASFIIHPRLRPSPLQTCRPQVISTPILWSKLHITVTFLIVETTPHRRKRQRLSSPTYDEQCSLSQHEVAAFDKFEESFSQSSKGSSPLKASQHAYGLDKAKREELNASALGLKKINTDDDTDENSGGMYILSVVYHNLACYRCSRYINIVAFRVFWKKRKS